ncbi:DMT family transporter [Microbacterium aquimaris]|uniref:DMT family transporter n=1 Tax=Microbacterium aquimaris TaxID=459816 RepID=UPI002AD3298B|nr:DMT family transporter [Microbacterium aquimaris]MDZ8276990.1 DMT family transporter [Microbacterium aquimaris]
MIADRPLAMVGAVMIGVLTAIQARVNGSLGERLQDGFVAAAVSFGSGLLILVAVSLALPAGRRGLTTLTTGLRARTVPWWMLIGGFAGAFSVATQSLTVAVIGVSLFTVGMVAGQAVNGLVLDRAGYGPAGVVAVTMSRVLGASIAVGAVLLSVTGESVRGVPWWMLVLPFLVGAGIAWQQATNGRLRQRVGSALTATAVNFAGGTLVLLAAAAVHVLLVGPPEAFPTEPWLYLGGALGVAYIFIGAAVVQHTGVLLMGLGAVVGQLTTSVVLDALWPTVASPGTVIGIVVSAIALVGAAIAVFPRARRRR